MSFAVGPDSECQQMASNKQIVVLVQGSLSKIRLTISPRLIPQFISSYYSKTIWCQGETLVVLFVFGCFSLSNFEHIITIFFAQQSEGTALTLTHHIQAKCAGRLQRS